MNLKHMNKRLSTYRTISVLDAVLYGFLMFGANLISYYVAILSFNII